MDMKEWAKREVEIACKKEKPKDSEPNMWDYGCACYESALKAFNTLCEDGHSGCSIGVTKNILMRLIDGKPLTPIEDTPDIWHFSFTRNEETPGPNVYQCSRMSSFFKEVYPDGAIKYDDIDRVTCVSVDNPNNWYSSGLVRGVINEMFPISMPYLPASNSFKVYCEDFLTDRKNGDFDTVGIFYAIKPDGERIEINRFFDGSGVGFKEITREEYDKRKKLAEELKNTV